MDAPPPPLALALARAIVAHPGRVALLALATGALGLALAFARLELWTDRTALLGTRHPHVRSFAALQADFRDVDAIVALVRAPTRAQARSAADALAARSMADPRLGGAFHRVPDEALRGRALLFLTRAEVLDVERRLADAEPALARLRTGGVAGLLEHVREALAGATATADGGKADDARLDDLRLLEAIVRGAGAPAAPDEPTPWFALAPASVVERDGYVWTSDGRAVVLVRPREAAALVAGPAGQRLEAVAALRGLAAEVSAATPGVEIGLTGGPVLEADEGATFLRDARWSTLAAASLVAAALVVALRRVGDPVRVLLAFAWGAAVTLGVAALWPGHLNVVTVVFCALLVGLGVDHGLHVVSRFDEARAAGLDANDALVSAVSLGAAPVVAAGLTTTLGFLATLFAEVDGVRELGVVAGVGSLAALVGQLLLLPALMTFRAGPPGAPADRPRPGWAHSALARGLDRLVERRPRLVVGLALVATALGLAVALGPGPTGRPRLRFDGNLLLLQAQGVESVRLASEVLTDAGIGGMFAAVVVEDEAALRRVEATLDALPTVGRTESLLDVVPTEQPAKLAALGRIGARVDLLLAAAPAAKLDPAARARAGEALARDLEPAARALLARGQGELAGTVLALQEALEALARAGASPRVDAWEATLLADLDATLRRLAEECRARAPVTAAALPAEVRARFVGASGRLLLRVYPKGDPWDPAALEAFLADLRREVADTGGFPVHLQESLRLLERGAVRAASLAAVFVALLLVVHLRGVAVPLLVVLAAACGVAWGTIAMALLGLVANPATLLAIPITLGVGTGYGLHMAHRDREARSTPSVAGAPWVIASSAGRAVVLSAVTTALAFAALGVAQHRGLASLGRAVAVGVACCLPAMLVLLPALLRLRAGPTHAPSLSGTPGPKTGPGGGLP